MHRGKKHRARRYRGDSRVAREKEGRKGSREGGEGEEGETRQKLIAITGETYHGARDVTRRRRGAQRF